MKNHVLNYYKYLVLFTIGLVLSPINLTAQISSPGFSQNISLPDFTTNNEIDFASGAIDIITANGKVFVYTLDKIVVMNDLGEIIKTIPFTEQYGKYNPIYHDPRLFAADVNFMAVFDEGGREDILVVTPNLDVILVNTDNYTDELKVSLPTVDPSDLSYFKPLNAMCIIKYDKIHNRLYWMIKARQDEGNCTGNFHMKDVYFGIYNYLPSGVFDRHYYYYQPTVAGNTEIYMESAISDIEFNENATAENDYFYLSKLNKIQVWEFDKNTQDLDVKLKHEIEVDADIYGWDDAGHVEMYKFSKMLYINEPGILGSPDVHKIVALPYRFPSVELEPGMYPQIYVIDCDNTSDPQFEQNQVHTISSPNQKIYDAIYLPDLKDLVICYSADPDEKSVITDPDTDIAVFRLNTSTQQWSLINNLLSGNSIAISTIDFNSPMNLINISNATLVNKKDEVVRLYYDGSNNIYKTDILPKTSGENNFFRRGTILGNNCFTINSAGGKIESFSIATGIHVSNTKTFYPVYHSTASLFDSKVYFYNKLNIENSGFYILDNQNNVININDDVYSNNDFTSPIGDCIFNPFKNEFLVSQNKDFDSDAAKVKCYSAVDNTLVDEIELEDNGTKYQNAKEMFIDPNGVLYVMVDMHIYDYTNQSDPSILMFDAATYEFIGALTLEMPAIVNKSEYYMAHFCYSKTNSTVYFTVTPQEVSLSPYNSEYNSMYSSVEFYTPNNGNLFSILNGVLTKEGNPLVNPGRIICPDDGDSGTESDFEGKVYILTDELSSYNISNKSMQFENKKLNELLYSPYHDKLYALADEMKPVNPQEDPCLEDRLSVVYEITLGGNGYVFTKVIDDVYIKGQSAAFFINPYDNKLYLHTKFDNEKLGGRPSQLISYDPESSDLTITNLNGDPQYAKNTSVYPELDHTGDYHYYTYNLTTPYIDPLQNKIYLPNGAHSNVSVVNFEAFETLSLEPGTNWISIPRHNRQTDPNWTLVEEVFDQGNFIEGYTYLELTYLNVSSTTPEPYTAEWSINWDFDPPEIDDVIRTFSTRGYKLDLLQPSNSNTLIMSGSVESSSSTIELFGEKDNWVGYFLYEKQDIFDALGYTAHYCTHIWAEDWHCYYDGPSRNPGNPQPAGTGWICTEIVHNIDYGEMVILSTDAYLPSDYTFTWQNSGQRNDEPPKTEAQNYTYTEEAEYTPIYILMDSTENPQEIGVFVNDTCVGACTVIPDDTLVGILAYMDGQTGDSITFSEWYGTKSTNSEKITSYYVYNPEKLKFEHRSIVIGENKDYYKVSFKKLDISNINNPENIFNFWIYPNPSENEITLEYTLSRDNFISLEVYDIFGRKVSVIIQGYQSAGMKNLKWDIKGNTGQKLKPGIYTIRLVAGGQCSAIKLLVK